GKGLLHAGADRPAMQGFAFACAGVHVLELGMREGIAAGAVDQRPVDGIAETRANGTAPRRLRLQRRSACGEALVVEVALDVGFNAIHPSVVEDIVAGITAEDKAAEVAVDRGDAIRILGPRPGIAGVHTDIEASPIV